MLRGTAFVFRAYDSRSDEVQRRWSAVFSAASVWSPFMLGCCIGAMASGKIRVSGTLVSGGYVAPWTGAFPFSVGAFVLSLFALLAATYLTLESDDPALTEDFRTRAMAAWAASGACAWMTLWTARTGAPLLYEGLWQSPWALPFQLMVGLLSGTVLWALTRRRYRWARALCIALVWAVVWGWGMAQYPWLVVPDLTIAGTAAPREALVPVLTVLALGAIPLAGSFWALYAVFKSAPANQLYRD